MVYRNPHKIICTYASVLSSPVTKNVSFCQHLSDRPRPYITQKVELEESDRIAAVQQTYTRPLTQNVSHFHSRRGLLLSQPLIEKLF
jgi:hypothetical protein